jgi:hypothetical protein
LIKILFKNYFIKIFNNLVDCKSRTELYSRCPGPLGWAVGDCERDNGLLCGIHPGASVAQFEGTAIIAVR